jgi:hypothetical protein
MGLYNDTLASIFQKFLDMPTHEADGQQLRRSPVDTFHPLDRRWIKVWRIVFGQNLERRKDQSFDIQDIETYHLKVQGTDMEDGNSRADRIPFAQTFCSVVAFTQKALDNITSRKN